MGAHLGAFQVPANAKMAGYVTGNSGVPWTQAQWAAHPDAVRIDQSPINTPADETADVYDLENGAGTLAGAATWTRGAWGSYRAGRRPGQRKPTLYCEQSSLTPLANTLNAAGITSGVNLFLTQPMPEHAAIDLVTNASGPYPIIGVQYQFEQLYDISIVSTDWLNTVSKPMAAATPKPGTQTGWHFCSKCQGLFWGPGQAQSVCPRGGTHDGSHSHQYTLGYAL